MYPVHTSSNPCIRLDYFSVVHIYQFRLEAYNNIRLIEDVIKVTKNEKFVMWVGLGGKLLIMVSKKNFYLNFHS